MNTKIHSEIFCPLPWIQIMIDNLGEVDMGCCITLEESLTSEFDTPPKIDNTIAPDAIINSEKSKRMRRNILQGVWNKECLQCKKIEDDGGVSLRNLESRIYREFQEGIIDETRETGEIKHGILSLDARVGNHCNLKCRMCDPYSSRKLLQDWEDLSIYTEYVKADDLDKFKEEAWIQKFDLSENLISQLPNLKRMTFAGGEPMVSKPLHRALEKCIEAGRAKDISLRFITNLTVLPDGIEDIWREFKHVDLLGSIDAYGPLNSLIRYPADWEKIDKNLKTLDRNHNAYNLGEICINSTIQVYNVFEIGKLCRYLSGEFEFVTPMPQLTPLVLPDYLSVQIMPTPIKERATDYLKQTKASYQARVHERHNRVLEQFDGLIEFMNATDNQNLIDTCRQVTEKWDTYRNEDTFALSPQLAEILK